MAHVLTRRHSYGTVDPAKQEVPESPRDDEGSIALFVVLLAVALMAMAGLVVDGGYALAARQEAAATAEQAARAGADALSHDSVRGTGPIRLDPAAATAAAQAYLAARGRAGQATAVGDIVNVTVSITRRTAILSALGIDSIGATAHASARGITGIDREEELR